MAEVQEYHERYSELKPKPPAAPAPRVQIPFELLPEGRKWKVGKSYRVRLLLRQVSTNEEGASFEVLDAFSLESPERGGRYFVTESGSYKA